VAELYDEVADGTELRSVVLAGRRLAHTPLRPVGGSALWTGPHAATGRTDPFTAGVFVAAMVAQIDVLAEHGHAWSEIVNESVIEAVDSLLPYMRARDVSYMVDNCSMTARLGARKWGPRFAAALDQLAFPAADGIEPLDPAPLAAFADHPVHGVLARLAPLRPPVDISV
jgi:ketol-acid reductoisomerase